MNTKALFLLLGGMSLSFVVVLGIMVSAVSNDKPRPKSRRVVITETVKEAKPPQKQSPTPRRQNQTQTPAPRPKTTAATRTPAAQPPKPTLQTEAVPAVIDGKPQRQRPEPVATTLPADVRPDPKTLREFSTLKKELRREIGSLKKDRDSMLEALAQSLVSLTAKEIAAELNPLDDEMAAQTLRHINKGKRDNVLAAMGSARAKKLRQRLRKLGVK